VQEAKSRSLSLENNAKPNKRRKGSQEYAQALHATEFSNPDASREPLKNITK